MDNIFINKIEREEEADLKEEFELYKNLIDGLDITDDKISCIAIKYPKKCFKYLAVGALATSLIEEVYLLTFTHKGVYLIKLGNGITVKYSSAKSNSRKYTEIRAKDISFLKLEEEYLANSISGYWLKIEEKSKHIFFLPNNSFSFENNILNNNRNIGLLIQNNFFELGNNESDYIS